MRSSLCKQRRVYAEQHAEKLAVKDKDLHYRHARYWRGKTLSKLCPLAALLRWEKGNQTCCIRAEDTEKKLSTMSPYTISNQKRKNSYCQHHPGTLSNKLCVYVRQPADEQKVIPLQEKNQVWRMIVLHLLDSTAREQMRKDAFYLGVADIGRFLGVNWVLLAGDKCRHVYV